MMQVASGNVFTLGDFEAVGVVTQIASFLAQPGVATASAAQSQSVPVGAIVLGATATVTAKPAGLATISSVAQVRDGTGSSLVVDFQGMRTVDRIQAPRPIKSIAPWAGTKFGDTTEFGVVDGDQSFSEIQAERVRVDLSTGISADALAADGAVEVLTPPADLELLVNGTRAWFAAGPAKPGGAASDPAAFGTTVDLGDAVRAAVAAATPGPTGIAVDVELRSSVPGQLTLELAISFQRTFAVVFPEGDIRVVAADEEGVYTLLLPLPAEAAGWQIHQVQAAVSGALPPERVLPPDAPSPGAGAELVLDPDHAVLVDLPPATLARLETVTAVRLLLGVDATGAELAGVLRADATQPPGSLKPEDVGVPGDPVPKANLGPVTLAPGSLDDHGWTTLPLPKPHKLVPNERLWLSVQLARGRIAWPLAEPAPLGLPHAPLVDATLRRQLPNGAFRALSHAGDVPTGAAAIRVVGTAPNAAPIDALELEIPGRAGSVSLTPTTSATPVSLGLDPPLTAAADPSAFDSGALKLLLTTRTPGNVSFAAVLVAYTMEGDSA